MRHADGRMFASESEREAGGPGLKAADLWAAYRGLKPAATPKGNDGDSDSASQNDDSGADWRMTIQGQNGE